MDSMSPGEHRDSLLRGWPGGRWEGLLKRQVSQFGAEAHGDLGGKQLPDRWLPWVRNSFFSRAVLERGACGDQGSSAALWVHVVPLGVFSSQGNVRKRIVSSACLRRKPFHSEIMAFLPLLVIKISFIF